MRCNSVSTAWLVFLSGIVMTGVLWSMFVWPFCEAYMDRSELFVRAQTYVAQDTCAVSNTYVAVEGVNNCAANRRRIREGVWKGAIVDTLNDVGAFKVFASVFGLVQTTAYLYVVPYVVLLGIVAALGSWIFSACFILKQRQIERVREQYECYTLPTKTESTYATIYDGKIQE